MIQLTHRPTASYQQGFTLIELMIAMIIFAMLALAGWQIMDNITKSRDRANLHANALSQLDFAYLQLAQDFAQTTNYVIMPVTSTPINTNSTTPPNTQLISPTFLLNPQQVSFVRFADPDPRYQQSPALAKVVYQIAGDKLIKQRFYGLNENNETPTSSDILTGIQDASWTALTWTASTPQTVDSFPDEATLQKVQQLQAKKAANQTTTPQNPTNTGQTNNPTASDHPIVSVDLLPYQQLPNGVELNFSYQGEKITWRFALPNPPPDSTIQ